MPLFFILFNSCFTSSLLYAHEFWLVPHGKIQQDKTVSISARVGAVWPGEQIVRLPNMVESLQVYYGNSAKGQSLTGRDNSHVFGHYKVTQPKTQTVILTTRNFSLKLSANEFNAYLREEGLNDTLEFRKKYQLLNDPSHEVFSRIAKTIPYVGQDNSYQHVFNLPLEISILSAPTNYKIGQKFIIKVTALGKPLSNQFVKAQLQDQKSELLTTRTNQQGIATFYLPKKGFWRWSTVSVQPISYGDVQWKSIWSSTTITVY